MPGNPTVFAHLESGWSGSLLMIAFTTRHALELSAAGVLAIVALPVFVGDGFDLIVGESPTLDEQLGDLLVRTAERLQLTVSMRRSPNSSSSVGDSPTMR